MNVYQKEIYELILDDILLEEVVRLNLIERRKKEQEKIINNSRNFYKKNIQQNEGLPKEAFELMVNLENLIDGDTFLEEDES